MDNNEMTEALQMKVRRSYRLATIRQYSLVIGGTLMAAVASALLVNEIQKDN